MGASGVGAGARKGAWIDRASCARNPPAPPCACHAIGPVCVALDVSGLAGGIGVEAERKAAPCSRSHGDPGTRASGGGVWAGSARGPFSKSVRSAIVSSVFVSPPHQVTGAATRPWGLEPSAPPPRPGNMPPQKKPSKRGSRPRACRTLSSWACVSSKVVGKVARQLAVRRMARDTWA